MALYKADFISNRNAGIRVGLSAVTSLPEEDRLVSAIANAMKRDGFVISYPYFPGTQSAEDVDFLVKLSTSSEYKGSGWNFLINFPGFLVWAPAWHGYNYRVIYGFDADITNSSTETELPRVAVPVDLEIRHADIGRTWTEISWLEWGIIALAGGIAFIRYDRDLTPELINATESRIADYVSSKIAATLIAAKQTAGDWNGTADKQRVRRFAKEQ